MELSIKVGYDYQTKMYAFKAPLYSVSNFSVNGKLVNDALLGYRSNGLVIINEKPEIITSDKNSKELTGYFNTENQESVTISDYNTIENSIAKIEKEYDNDNNLWIYKNIEDEIYVTRFFRNHKAIYENINSVHVYEIEIIEYPVSAFSEIIPLYAIDAKNVFETKCTYTPNILNVFNETVAKYGILHSEIEIPSHSGIKYAKIKGEYINGTEKIGANPTIGTYAECMTRRLKSYEDMDFIISMHFAKRSKKVLDKCTVGGVIIELTEIVNSVYGLKVSSKDSKSQTALQIKINSLIETYKKLA